MPDTANGNTIDYRKSVPFRFERELGRTFRRLQIWLGSQVVDEAKNGKHHIRKSTPLQIYNATDCLLANLLDARRRSKDCFVGIPLAEATFTKSQYCKIGFGYTNFVRVLNFFRNSSPPLVIFKAGFNDRKTKKSFVSRFRASPHLLKIVHGYVEIFIGGEPGKWPGKDTNRLIEEAIKHTNAKATPVAIPNNATQHRHSSDCIRLKDGEKRLKKYTDTSETIAMRKELEAWNKFIANYHHVDLLLPDSKVLALYKKQPDEFETFFNDDDTPSFVEFERTRLYRVFNNGSFGEGGRFYGGWWQHVPKDYRPFITINERATWEYDYSNLHAAMLYAEIGLPLDDDAYSLDGVERTRQNRDLIKTTFLKLINAHKDQRLQRPKADALPKGWSWDDLQNAIIRKHEPIAHQFRTGIGLKLQKRDAAIAMDVMKQMMKEKVLVLPVHDSFITYHEMGKRLESEMKTAYRKFMKREILIKPNLSLVQDFNADMPKGVKLMSEEVIDHFQSQDEYEGFQIRHNEFWPTQSAEWRHKFGY